MDQDGNPPAGLRHLLHLVPLLGWPLEDYQKAETRFLRDVYDEGSHDGRQHLGPRFQVPGNCHNCQVSGIWRRLRRQPRMSLSLQILKPLPPKLHNLKSKNP